MMVSEARESGKSKLMGPRSQTFKGAATLQKLGGSESGEAQIEGAKRPRFEGEARIKGEARERAGGGVWGGGSGSPSPENFWNFELQIVQSGVYLKPKSWYNRFFKENTEKHFSRTFQIIRRKIRWQFYVAIWWFKYKMLLLYNDNNI